MFCDSSSQSWYITNAKTYLKIIMRKIILSVAIAFGAFTSTFAQEAYPCHTDEKTTELIESLTPQQRIQYENDQQSYDSEIQNFIANNPELLVQSDGNQRAITYTVPVVFHIIHEGGSENISEDQIMNALQHLNDDYQKSNTQWSNVNANFLPIVADVEIEFKLAKLDGSGNCTNGITRTYSSVTNGASGSDRIAVVQAQHGNWPGDKYINFYIAKDIDGAAGYTYRPNTWIGASMENGIHVLHNYVGSIGTAGSSGAHTLSHEVGHWLDLPHLWGTTNTPGLASNCGDDDGISDTPNTIGWSNCNVNGTSCGSLDNVENFMEYSYCSKMFTNGQKVRMHGALSSNVGGRDNITKAANLVATGVNLPDIMCEASFKADKQEICPGQSVSFEDLSFSGPTGWTWNFPGGSPSSSTSQNPTVTYNTPGTYAVTLTATDGSTSKSVTENSFIKVLPLNTSLPIVESFEGLSNFNGSFWTVGNHNNNAKFDITTTAAYTGSKSVVLKNFGQSAGNIDDMASSPIDLSTVTTETTLSFRYAYRKRSASNDEWLRIFITNNCGENWTQRKTIRGNALGSITSGSSWKPTSQSDWTTVHMTNITASYWTTDFRFKFEFESDGGNNLYLDDVNIYEGSSSEDPLSVSNEDLIKSFSVYPNPADHMANVTFSIENNQNVNVSLVNMMGQTIQSNTIQAQTGSNLVMLDTEKIQAGIYLVKVNIGGAQQVKRLIIK
ncbi:T9SS type A sorting domain-containing protein [Brumimicrobium glaciale]|uniref:T9SS type A sorting domain-containing protein n=2 Tax=Brumimicrobium glaciale TaxID=200475 RepID=A0A4Q4KQ09_9FLAO|nr:T9SS type A sorting domain-containing protein [Brumimicrobium glaciale]